MIIVLFGPPGVGKNFVGEILEREYGFHFVDGDNYLTPIMLENINKGQMFTQEMRDSFVEIIIEKIQLLKQCHNRLVISQALIKNVNRFQILNKLPEVKFIHVSSDFQTIISRIRKRHYEIKEEVINKILDAFETANHTCLTLENKNDGEMLRTNIETLLEIKPINYLKNKNVIILNYIEDQKSFNYNIIDLIQFISKRLIEQNVNLIMLNNIIEPDGNKVFTSDNKEYLISELNRQIDNSDIILNTNSIFDDFLNNWLEKKLISHKDPTSIIKIPMIIYFTDYDKNNSRVLDMLLEKNASILCSVMKNEDSDQIIKKCKIFTNGNSAFHFLSLSKENLSNNLIRLINYFYPIYVSNIIEDGNYPLHLLQYNLNNQRTILYHRSLSLKTAKLFFDARGVSDLKKNITDIAIKINKSAFKCDYQTISVRLYQPINNKKNNTSILYFPGTGFTRFISQVEDSIAQDISNSTGASVFCLKYRLAPEHHFPTALYDCKEMVEFLVKDRYLVPKNTIVIGYSSGATLALQWLKILSNDNHFEFSKVFLLSPKVDFTRDLNTQFHNLIQTTKITSDFLAWTYGAYLTGSGLPIFNEMAYKLLKGINYLALKLTKIYIISGDNDFSIMDRDELYQDLLSNNVLVQKIEIANSDHCAFWYSPTYFKQIMSIIRKNTQDFDVKLLVKYSLVNSDGDDSCDRFNGHMKSELSHKS